MSAISDPHVAAGQQRQHRALHRPRGERLLLDRSRTQHRAVDPRALGHQQPEVDLGLGAGADPDRRDPADGARARRDRRAGWARRRARGSRRTARARRTRRARSRARRARRPGRAGRGCAPSRSPARPAARPSWIAAVPTPPAPPWTSRRSPARSPACVNSASWAVVNTSGVPPASGPREALWDRHQDPLVDDRELGLAAAADDPHHPLSLLEALAHRAHGPRPRRRARAPVCPCGAPGGAG